MRWRWIVVNGLVAGAAAWVLLRVLHGDPVWSLFASMGAGIVWPLWATALADWMRVRNAEIMRRREEQARRTKG